MKIYQRYELLSRLGVIAQSDSDIILINGSSLPKQFLDRDNQLKRTTILPLYVICGAYQDINIWNVHTKEKVDIGLKHPQNDCKVTKLIYIKPMNYIAAGYTNGSVVVWDLVTADSVVSFDGHRASISVLLYDQDIMNIIFSGGQDNDIICWDLISHSGIYRLKGHLGPITSLKLIKKDVGEPILISSSKDTFIKLWDTSLQHCFATLVGHNHEVWDFVLFDNFSRLMSFSSDNELRIWKLIKKETDNASAIKRCQPEFINKVIPVECEFLGSIETKTSQRTLVTRVIGNLIIQLVADSKIYIYKILNDEEKDNVLKKRMKKAVKDSSIAFSEIKLSDEIKLVSTIKINGKVKYFSLLRVPYKNHVASNDNFSTSKRYIMAVLKKNNAIEMNTLTISNNNASHSSTKIDITLDGTISRFGHRKEITQVTIDSYNNTFISLSKDSIKLWDFHQNQLIKTVLETEEVGATSCLFAPGSRFVIVAFVSGEIRIYSLVDGSLVECVVAMELTAKNSNSFNIGLGLLPDKKGIVSYNKNSNEDDHHEIKFWDFELINGDINKLSITHKRTLQLADTILDVKFSPNLKFVLATLMDNTIKIFFLDTLKFYLTLYGHKLPVTSADISSDSTLIVTGSLDKNIKLWGIDFGDCHKSLFAHDQGVTCVKFIPKTHYFFSCSRDGKLRYWDGDTYDLLLTFDEHFSPLLWLDVSSCGRKMIACGSDKTISIWEKSDEQFVLEEERERLNELELEKTIEKDSGVLSAHSIDEINKTSIETVKETEKLIEQIDFCIKNELSKKTVDKELRNSILTTLRSIKQTQIEQCLSLLPTSYVTTFLRYLINWLETNLLDVELCSRCAVYLFRIHYNFLLNKIPMEKIKETIQQRILSLRDLVGFNVSALKYMEYQKYGPKLNRDILEEIEKKKLIKNRKKKLALNVVF